jgi:hypothetical protein
LSNTITETSTMITIHNRAVGIDQPPEQHRQADPARTSNRSAPPAPPPGPRGHPFTERLRALMAGGKTKGQAMREAIKTAPADHESWLRAVQSNG